MLTSKGGESLPEADLKGRLILGGQNDPDLGMFETASPTAALLGHNLIISIANTKGWKMWLADASAAFLQGKPLPESRDIYFKVPKGW